MEQRFESDDFLTAWEAFEEAFEALKAAIMEEIRPLFEAFIEVVGLYIEVFQRIWLKSQLMRVMPYDWAEWLADRWPKRLLPPCDWVFGKETDE